MPEKRAAYLIRFAKARLGAMLLHRSARRRHGLFDRLCNYLLARITSSTATQPDHFMRDELIDEDVEFDPAELSRMLQRSDSPLHDDSSSP